MISAHEPFETASGPLCLTRRLLGICTRTEYGRDPYCPEHHDEQCHESDDHDVASTVGHESEAIE